MSKSYDNTLEIFCPEKELRKKVMSIVTDSTPIDQPKNPDTSALYQLSVLFSDEAGKQALRERFLTPGLRYGDVKKELFGLIWEYFAPYREKRKMFADDPAMVRNILKQGAEKVRAVGMEYLHKARRNVGLDY